MNIDGLGAIAEVAIGLTGFSGVFVALTRTGAFAPPEAVRLSFLLYTTLGSLFLSLVPHALFTASLSDVLAWRVLGLLAVVHASGLLIPAQARATTWFEDPGIRPTEAPPQSHSLRISLRSSFVPARFASTSCVFSNSLTRTSPATKPPMWAQ